MTKNISQRPVLILGGGLAGLSTAYHLKSRNNLVVEKSDEVGGTARSFSVNGFTFDITGHLLHLHSAYTKKLIPMLLKNQFYSCVRKAWIHSNGTDTKYPFQAYTRGLPQQVVDECVLGFIDAYMKNQENGRPPFKDFKSWCLGIFGAGISKHFMIPYNEKLYQAKAERMSTDWCGPFVPMPKLSDVIRGAINDTEGNFGYNTTFLYPKKGGIQQLARAFANRLDGVYMNTSITKLDWKNKRATLSNGETVSYSHMVNTIPLLELLKLMGPLPANVRAAKDRLRFASILCVNLGVNRSKISDASWIYYPESKFPFYRVGFPMNFTPHAVPKGCSSMYVEVPQNAVKGDSNATLLKKIRIGLIEANVLKRTDKFRAVQFLPVKYAYVIYDHHRNQALKTIFSFLAQQKIQTIGRYGAWKYSFMEEAILDGKKAAENIINGSRRPH